jgi:hypothetical protein
MTKTIDSSCILLWRNNYEAEFRFHLGPLAVLGKRYDWGFTAAGRTDASGRRRAKPVLLRAVYDAGHTGLAATKRQTELNTDDLIAIAVWQIGEPDFQPKAATLDKQ